MWLHSGKFVRPKPRKSASVDMSNTSAVSSSTSSDEIRGNESGNSPMISNAEPTLMSVRHDGVGYAHTRLNVTHINTVGWPPYGLPPGYVPSMVTQGLPVPLYSTFQNPIYQNPYGMSNVPVSGASDENKDLRIFEQDKKPIYPRPGEDLLDFLLRIKESDSTIAMWPKCNVVFDKEAAKEFEKYKVEEKEKAELRKKIAEKEKETNELKRKIAEGKQKLGGQTPLNKCVNNTGVQPVNQKMKTVVMIDGKPDGFSQKTRKKNISEYVPLDPYKGHGVDFPPLPTMAKFAETGNSSNHPKCNKNVKKNLAGKRVMVENKGEKDEDLITDNFNTGFDDSLEAIFGVKQPIAVVSILPEEYSQVQEVESLEDDYYDVFPGSECLLLDDNMNPATFLHAYTCFPLAYATRQAAGAILQDIANSGVLFAILMCRHKV
ncbi:hypothetical protein Ahy_A07g033398 isoform B [Arachis hypogaea]|uniref:Vacuolar fusion protein MON1 homolog n=1 Tax=Arachis hypogaea TaxID=3818 RepID=A0A445C946_ARAHY|nr:hypothetical protein Ahy_A07g033398 isoform B [Arachis hypogaea]